MPEQRNLFLAITLSALVLFGWQYLIGIPAMEDERARQAQIFEQQEQQEQAAQNAQIPGGMQGIVSLPRTDAIAQSTERVALMTPTLSGSINLTGGRFDDLKLRQYRVTPDADSPEIDLLSPANAEHPYFIEFGWIAPPSTTGELPGPTTQWTWVSGDSLTPGADVTLSYDDGLGLTFTRRISVDERYMFTIVDQVQNNGPTPAVLYPYALVSRQNVPETQSFWVVHEGFIGVANGTLQDDSYDDLGDDFETASFESTGGWLGLTDKYWMTALIPPQNEEFTGTNKAYDAGSSVGYQADYLLAPRTVAPGAMQEVTHRFFAGAKVNNIITDYEDAYDIVRFDLAIDWGWLFFLTKPIFLALDYLYNFVGNFGVAILIFTVFVKLLFFPLANTSYRAMSKMKKLQPEMEALRERFKDDKAKQQQELMELYRKKKVNPLAGCLPVVIQIPVFFSLYKVLFVTIEMRHAPFFGWIRDLSAPDPSSIFNLFGLLPYDVPSFLLIGVFPIMMGVSMSIQMSLNPPPADPTQARIIAFMPWVFMFMLASFPAGLVIYWTWNNILSIAQQAYIMKRSGVPVDLFDRLRARIAWLKRAAASKDSARKPD